MDILLIVVYTMLILFEIAAIGLIAYLLIDTIKSSKH